MKKKKWFQVALVQMTSTDDVQENLLKVTSFLKKLFIEEQRQLDLVCFPENSLYLHMAGQEQKLTTFSLKDKCFQDLATFTHEHDFYLHLGSVPLSLKGKVFNGSLLISPKGEIKNTYCKMHLFDTQMIQKGKENSNSSCLRESYHFSSGESPSFWNCKDWQVGESICYDLRFGELYSFYARKGVEIILVPSAFLPVTGAVHWHTLLRARAIETQSYILAAAQVGTHKSQSPHIKRTRATYGHSLVVDPWGDIMGELTQKEEGFLCCALNYERLQKVRQQMPMRVASNEKHDTK